jgi:acyl-CoA synthetase (AMP-forming)/AMP-acid ligase II
MWNHSRHLEAYFAVPVVGGVLHTLNLRLHPDELAYIVNHAGDRFLIVDDVLLPVFERIRDRVNLQRVIVAPFSGLPVAAGYEDYEALLQSSDGDPVYADLDDTDPAGMCYTSGTTGKPKGVVYTHRSIALHSLAISLPDAFAITRHDTVLPAMSMFHANAWGFPHAAVMNGSSLVLPGPNVQPDRILDLMSRHQVTLTGAVPTVWLGAIEALERQPDRWRLTKDLRIVMGGSAVPETLFRRFDRVGVRVIQLWGMTETAPMATVSTLKPHMDAWTGYIRIVDRAEDLIKSGGEWISSVDVENALVAHPAVAEAAVISVPHPKWQERPLAVVVLKPDRSASADELRAFLESRFAKWQVPDHVVFVPELPHTSTGKLLKSELRTRFQYWNLTGTRDEPVAV